MKFYTLKIILYIFLLACMFGCEKEKIEIIERWEEAGTLNGVHKNNSAFHILNANSIWAVGEEIWNYDGATWNIVQSPTVDPLISVSGSSDLDIWILAHSDYATNINGSWATSSEVWNWNGFEWKEIDNLNSGMIYSILVIDLQTIVIGSSGAIHISYDAGNTWIKYNIPTDSYCDDGKVKKITGEINNLFISLNCGMLAEFNGVSWNTYSNSGSFGSGCGEIDKKDNKHYAIIYTASNVTPVFGDFYLKKYQNEELQESINITTTLYNDSYSDQVQASLRNATLDVPSDMFFGSDNIYMYNGNDWIQETDINEGIRILQMVDNQRGWAITENGKILKR